MMMKCRGSRCQISKDGVLSDKEAKAANAKVELDVVMVGEKICLRMLNWSSNEVCGGTVGSSWMKIVLPEWYGFMEVETGFVKAQFQRT
jgi:hypothetical protein